MTAALFPEQIREQVKSWPPVHDSTIASALPIAARSASGINFLARVLPALAPFAAGRARVLLAGEILAGQRANIPGVYLRRT